MFYTCDELQMLSLQMLASEDLDELVCEAKAQEASNINNGGPAEQIDYLTEFHGLSFVFKMFKRQLAEDLLVDQNQELILCSRCREPLRVQDVAQAKCLNCGLVFR